jgi:hypothetical protein
MGENERAAIDRASVDRRTMLKTAVGAGVGAVAWSAPRIDTFGFAPAGASHFGSQCVILSPEGDDKNSNDDDNAYCSPGELCCGQSFGNEGQIDTFTFVNPTPTCSELVVRTIPLDCNTADLTGNVPKPKNPDVGAFAVVISSTTGTCDCTILDGVLVDSSQRTVLKSLNNGPHTCAGVGSGVVASMRASRATTPCSHPTLASRCASPAKLAWAAPESPDVESEGLAETRRVSPHGRGDLNPARERGQLRHISCLHPSAPVPDEGHHLRDGRGS